MSATLLEKTRLLNRALQSGSPEDESLINFNEIAEILSDTINSNAYILGEKGELMGHHFLEGFNCDVMEKFVYQEGKMPESYNEGLIATDETISNIPNTNGLCIFQGEKCVFGDKKTTVVPIFAGNKRQGSLMLGKFNVDFTDDDLILAEYGATFVGIEMLRLKNKEEAEENRERVAVQIALDTLSYSEMEAIEHIFSELEGDEGILVASKIADRVGITQPEILGKIKSQRAMLVPLSATCYNIFYENRPWRVKRCIVATVEKSCHQMITFAPTVAPQSCDRDFLTTMIPTPMRTPLKKPDSLPPKNSASI